MRTWICLVALLASVADAPAAAADSHPVRAELLVAPERGAVVARAGVLLHIEPGWHVYWRNPGDAGIATSVELTTPEGVEVGGLEWPLPFRFSDPGDIVTYGYQDSVLLASDLRLPAQQQPFTVRAEVAWLACKEACLLGDASLTASLDPNGTPSAATRELFDRWRGQLPMHSGQQPPFSVHVTGGLEAQARSGELTAWLSWPGQATPVEWYPLPLPGTRVHHPLVRSRGATTRVDLKVTVQEEPRPDDLPFLVVIEGTQPQDRRTGYQVSIPMPRS